jgi:hypothetical protein
LVAVEPHAKPFCKTIKIHFFPRTKEFKCKGKFPKIGPKGSHGFDAGRQGTDGARHLDAPDLLPRRRLVKNGCSSLTACQGFLDMPGSRIREEVELESEIGIIDRGGPGDVLDRSGEGHGVLSLYQFFRQFPEIFLSWNGCFGFHEFFTDETYSGTGACELQPGPPWPQPSISKS